MAAPPATFATSQNGSSQEKAQTAYPSTGYCSRCVRICIKCQGAPPQQSGHSPHMPPPNPSVFQQQQQQHPVTCQCSGRSLPVYANNGHGAVRGPACVQVERLSALAFDQPTSSLQYEQQVTQTMPLEYFQQESEPATTAADVSAARLQLYPMFMQEKITEEATLEEVTEKTSRRDSAPSTWQEASRHGRQDTLEWESQEEVTYNETVLSQSLLKSENSLKELRSVAMQVGISQDQLTRPHFTLTEKPENLSENIKGMGESHSNREQFLNKFTQPERSPSDLERHSGHDLKRRQAEHASCQKVMDCLQRCFQKLEEIQQSPGQHDSRNTLCGYYPQRRDSVDNPRQIAPTAAPSNQITDTPSRGWTGQDSNLYAKQEAFEAAMASRCPPQTNSSDQQEKLQSDTALEHRDRLKSPVDKSGSVTSKKQKARISGVPQSDSSGKQSILPKDQPSKTESVASKHQQASRSSGSPKKLAVSKEQLSKAESQPTSGILGTQPDTTKIKYTLNREGSSLYKQEYDINQQLLHEMRDTIDAIPLKPEESVLESVLEPVPQESTPPRILSRQSDMNTFSQTEGLSKQEEPSEFIKTERVTPRESVLKKTASQQESVLKATLQHDWALKESASQLESILETSATRKQPSAQPPELRARSVSRTQVSEKPSELSRKSMQRPTAQSSKQCVIVSPESKEAKTQETVREATRWTSDAPKAPPSSNRPIKSEPSWQKLDISKSSREQSKVALPRPQVWATERPPRISDSADDTQWRTSDSADAPRRTLDSADIPRRTSDSVDTPRRRSDSADATRRRSDSADTPRRISDSADTPRQTSDSVDAPRRTLDSADTPRRISDSAHSPRQTSNSADALRRRLDSADAPRRTSDNMDTPRRTFDNVNTPRRTSGSADTHLQKLVSENDLTRKSSAGKATPRTPDKEETKERGRSLHGTYKAKSPDKEKSPPIKSDQEKRLSADGSRSSSLTKQSSISGEKSTFSALSENTEPPQKWTEKPQTEADQPQTYSLQAYYLPLYQCAFCQQITPYPVSCQMGVVTGCPSPYDPCQCQLCYPSILPQCLPCPSPGYLLPYPQPFVSEQSGPHQSPQMNTFQHCQPLSPRSQSNKQVCYELAEPCPRSSHQLISEPAEPSPKPSKKQEDPAEENDVKERPRKGRGKKAAADKFTKPAEACQQLSFQLAEPCQPPCFQPAQQPCCQPSAQCLQCNHRLSSEPVELSSEPSRKQEKLNDLKDMLKKDSSTAAKVEQEAKPAQLCQQPCSQSVVEQCPQSKQQLCPEPGLCSELAEQCSEPCKKHEYSEKTSDAAEKLKENEGKTSKLNERPESTEPCQEPCFQSAPSYSQTDQDTCPLSCENVTCPTSASCMTCSESGIRQGLCQSCQANESVGGISKRGSIHSNQSDLQSYRSNLMGTSVSPREAKTDVEEDAYQSKGEDRIGSIANGPSNTSDISTGGTSKKQNGTETENDTKENLKRGEEKITKLEELDKEYEWDQKSGKDKESTEIPRRESASRRWTNERDGNGETSSDKRGKFRRAKADDSSEEMRRKGSGTKLQRSPHRPASAKSGSSGTSKLTTSEGGKSRKRRVLDGESHNGRRANTKITQAAERDDRRKTGRSLGQSLLDRTVVGPTWSYKGVGRAPRLQLSPAFQTLSKTVLRKLELAQTTKDLLSRVEKTLKPKKDSSRIDRRPPNPPCPVSGEHMPGARGGASRRSPSIFQDRSNQKRDAQYHQKHMSNETKCSLARPNDGKGQESTTETKGEQIKTKTTSYPYLPSSVEAPCASNEKLGSYSRRYPYPDDEKRRNIFSPYYLTPTGAPHRAIGSIKRHKVTKRSNHHASFPQQKQPKVLPSSSSSSNADDFLSYQSADPDNSLWQESQCSCPEWMNRASFPEYHNCCTHVWANAPHFICPLHPHHMCLRASCPPSGRRRHSKAKPLSLRSQRTRRILLRGRLHPGEQKPR